MHVDLDVHVHGNVDVVVDGFCYATSSNKFNVDLIMPLELLFQNLPWKPVQKPG